MIASSPARAAHLLAHAVAAALGGDVLLEAVVDQRVQVLDRFGPHVAAAAAIAAVGAAELDELLAPERDAAVPAAAGLGIDLRCIEKLHDAHLSRHVGRAVKRDDDDR